jgi:hypothetical protein
MDDGGAVFGGGQFTHPTVLLMVFATLKFPKASATFP